MNPDRSGEIAIVIADDHAMVRSGLQRILEGELGLRVTGQAGDGAAALARLRDTRCDVLLLDLGMPPPSGVDLIKRVRAEWPRLAILVVSMHNHPKMVRAALAAGANGYVAKDSDPEVLVAALRQVAGGGHYLEPGLADALAFAPAAEPGASLSPREREVLRRLAAGQTNSEIAAALFLSEKTISTHKANLMAKLGLQSMADLVRYADLNLPPASGDCA
jgi:DNA-binding NarL/FixJ family response regulator